MNEDNSPFIMGDFNFLSNQQLNGDNEDRIIDVEAIKKGHKTFTLNDVYNYNAERVVENIIKNNKDADILSASFSPEYNELVIVANKNKLNFDNINEGSNLFSLDDYPLEEKGIFENIRENDIKVFDLIKAHIYYSDILEKQNEIYEKACKSLEEQVRENRVLLYDPYLDNLTVFDKDGVQKAVINSYDTADEEEKTYYCPYDNPVKIGFQINEVDDLTEIKNPETIIEFKNFMDKYYAILNSDTPFILGSDNIFIYELSPEGVLLKVPYEYDYDNYLNGKDYSDINELSINLSDYYLKGKAKINTNKSKIEDPILFNKNITYIVNSLDDIIENAHVTNSFIPKWIVNNTKKQEDIKIKKKSR